ncbi:hypothetical protein D3C86_1938200 [compost metagenome]
MPAGLLLAGLLPISQGSAPISALGVAGEVTRFRSAAVAAGFGVPVSALRGAVPLGSGRMGDDSGELMLLRVIGSISSVRRSSNGQPAVYIIPPGGQFVRVIGLFTNC